MAEELGGGAELGGEGPAFPIAADVTDKAAAQAAVATAVKTFTRLDTSVDDAGVLRVEPIADALLEEAERRAHLDPIGLVYGAHAVCATEKDS